MFQLHPPEDLFIIMSSCSRGTPLCIRQRRAESPLFPAGIRILQVSEGPEEAAEDGLRHEAACLRRCNRQLGPGERALAVSMPPASSHLKPDKERDAASSLSIRARRRRLFTCAKLSSCATILKMMGMCKT